MQSLPFFSNGFNDTRIAPHFMLSQSYKPLIYYVNRYFLMFGGSQVQKPYHASMNGFLNFGPWYHHYTEAFR